MNKIKILITGGAGAIGSNLVKKLIKKNHSIIVLDNLTSGYKINLPKGINFIKGNICNTSTLKKVFNYSPDLVIHTAAFFANQNSVDHPDKDLNTNGLGTLKLLEMSKLKKVSKFIYISSSCVYGNQKLMTENNKIFYPDTPYAITKLLGEYYCKFYSNSSNMNISIARIFNCYGPGEFPGKYRNVIPNFIHKALNNKDLVITGNGSEIRDFTYVDDVIDGILLLRNKNIKQGEIFNLGSGKKTKIIDLAKKIIRLTNSKSKIVFSNIRDWDKVTTRLANIDKTKKILNYNPKTDLDIGLEKTISWIKNHKI